jgi:biotin operon repressor
MTSIKITVEQFAFLVENYRGALEAAGILAPKAVVAIEEQVEPKEPTTMILTTTIPSAVNSDISEQLKALERDGWEVEIQDVEGVRVTTSTLLPASPVMQTQVDAKPKRTLTAEQLEVLKAGKAAKKARLGYKISDNVASIVAEIDAGLRVAPTASAGWRKGQAHHPNNPSVQKVIGVFTTQGSFLTHEEIVRHTGLKVKTVNNIMRELKKQGIMNEITRENVQAE